MEFSDGRLTACASDTYTVARDRVPVDCAGLLRVGVTREGLAELDKAGREDKTTKERRGIGTLQVFPGDAVKFVSSTDVETAVECVEIEPEFWDAVDELMSRLTARDPALPEVIAFDPALLMRFSKVKTKADVRVMDCYLTDVYAPVLVKIGADFEGAIMPIDREDYADKNGEDGLWTERN